MRSNIIPIALLTIFAGCNSGHDQSAVTNLPAKQKQFVELIHKHDAMYSGLANNLAKAEYISKSHKEIAEFALFKIQDVIDWQATLNRLDVLEADSLINAEFLLSNIYGKDSIFLQSSFPFDSLQLKEQLKPIKVNDKVSISGAFMTNNLDKLDEEVDFTLDDQRKFKTTRFLFYLMDVKKAK